MSTPAYILALATKLQSYLQLVVAKMKEKPARVLATDNSARVGGLTLSQIKALTQAPLTTHTANKNNPHNVTAAQVGSYTTSEFYDSLLPLIPTGRLPVSQYGSLTGLPPACSYAGWVLSMPGDVKAMVWGCVGTLASTGLDVSTLGSTDAPFFIYVRETAGTLSYEVSRTLHTGDPTRLLVGRGHTTSAGIQTVAIDRVTEVMGRRCSTTPIGHGIPVSSGVPSQPGSIDAGWK